MKDRDKVPASDEYLTTAEAAKILRVTPHRVHQLEKLGDLASVRNQFRWRLFLRGDVLALAEDRLLQKERNLATAKAALRGGE